MNNPLGKSANAKPETNQTNNTAKANRAKEFEKQL